MLQELSFKKYLAGALVLGSLVSAEPALAKTHHTAKTSQSSESSFTKEKAMKVIEDNKKLLDAIENRRRRVRELRADLHKFLDAIPHIQQSSVHRRIGKIITDVQNFGAAYLHRENH